MRRTLLAVCLVAAASSGLHAEESAGVKKIPVADCTLPKVWMTRDYESISRDGETEKSLMPMLSKMQAFAEKAHDSTRPVGDQLSAQERADFNVLRSRMIALQYRQLIESRYQEAS